MALSQAFESNLNFINSINKDKPTMAPKKPRNYETYTLYEKCKYYSFNDWICYICVGSIVNVVGYCVFNGIIQGIIFLQHKIIDCKKEDDEFFRSLLQHLILVSVVMNGVEDFLFGKEDI